MKIIYPILFASIAAIGNAIFAYAQKSSVSNTNRLIFVGFLALVAVILSFIFSPFFEHTNALKAIKLNYISVLIGGIGLFLTYLGFNLLYSKYGVSYYILYAVISIITTTIIVGILYLKEPFNIYQKVSVIFAVIAVALYSYGQTK